MFNWRRNAPDDGPVVLDEAYLARLAGHLGDECLRELLADGLLELSDRIDLVEELASSQQTADLARLCHDLAGMAGHLGLSELAKHAAEGERALRAPGGSVREVSGQLVASAAPAIAAIRFFLDGASNG